MRAFQARVEMQNKWASVVPRGYTNSGIALRASTAKKGYQSGIKLLGFEQCQVTLICCVFTHSRMRGLAPQRSLKIYESSKLDSTIAATVEEWAFQAHVETPPKWASAPVPGGYTNSGIALEGWSRGPQAPKLGNKANHTSS
jgi:hypothetical protein